MSIRIQLLLFGVLGNLLIASVFLFSSTYREDIQETSAGDSLVVLYESAWFQTYNTTFERMSRWLPNIGENGEFWNPDVEVFPDEVETEGAILNPILDSINSKSLGNAQYLIELLFEDDLDEANLSFVMAYFPSGERIYCGSALDLFGIDACSPKARPEFFSYLDSYIKDAITRPRQSTLRIVDSENKQVSTLNQSLTFPVKIEDETIAVVVLGSDIRKALEVFEDEFEVRTGVQTPSGLISLDDDYSADNVSSENERYGITNYKESIVRANEFALSKGSRYSTKDSNLGNSVTLIPLSSFLSSDDAELYIFKDEKESIASATEIVNLSFVVAALLFILILSITAYVTAKTFGGITRAIEVLEGLTTGDHTQQMPKRTGLLASDKDEVGHLSTALQSYRGHLLEMEEIRTEQAKRRKERDGVIIEKMTHLAGQLEGEAKSLILDDISRMTELAEEGTEKEGEEASVELMQLAFSRMSDEVNALIEARTSEMETARDEARDANAQKTRFFANMSHELRTPLNAILGYGEMLAEECEDLGYDDLLPDLKKITSAGTHLLSLISNILDISKIEAGKMELYVTSFEIESMIETIRDVANPVIAKNDNGFQINLDGALGSMTQDETKIRQCLTNYLSNAGKFTINGTVTLDVESYMENDVETEV